MKTLLFLGFILSFNTVNATGYGTLCTTHGECQEVYQVQTGTVCYKEKTGIDINGVVSCKIRCYYRSVGSFCDKAENSAVGICRREEFQMPNYDPADPNTCKDAIDPFDS